MNELLRPQRSEVVEVISADLHRVAQHLFDNTFMVLVNVSVHSFERIIAKAHNHHQILNYAVSEWPRIRHLLPKLPVSHGESMFCLFLDCVGKLRVVIVQDGVRVLRPIKNLKVEVQVSTLNEVLRTLK